MLGRIVDDLDQVFIILLLLFAAAVATFFAKSEDTKGPLRSERVICYFFKFIQLFV
jgi:hypothetical protein